MRVLTGSYNIYNYSGGWVYKTRQTAGGEYALTTYGGPTTRGFKGIAKSSSNKIDVVMYYYY